MSERLVGGLTVSCGLVGAAVANRAAIDAWLAACGPNLCRMAGAAASGAIRVAQTSDFLALPARGDKTLSVTVRVDSEGRYWIGVRELTQAARGNCNSSTANDALRDMLDSGDSEKGKALMAALGGSEERIQLPGGGKPAMACQVKRVAAVLEATATDATSPDQRKEIVDLIEKHALQHARGELSKLKERTCICMSVCR